MGSYLHEHIQPYVGETDTVLDLCCGPCNPTKRLKSGSKVGVDLDPEVLEIAKEFCIPIKLDASKIGEIFPEKSVDVVLWLDGIEHLTLPDAMTALTAAEKIARKRIVVFTPNEKAFFDLDNEFLRHKSFFPVVYWLERGYKVNSKFTSAYKGTRVNMLLAVKEIDG